MKPLAPKTTLQNRYQITDLIGKGGMGEVYLAIDQRLGHSVALKRTTVNDDVLLAEAFEREARTLAQLRHSILPKVSDHFVENDEQFLVMEYISGEDLSERLKSTNKPFPLNWVMFWADQLLEALNYLHNYDPPIIHRDIKPQNLKLTNENQIVLLDFGLSKNTLGHTQITTSGSVVGYTPHYASMEQIRGTGTNARSDIFSLSATLYQLLSNTIPVDALTRADAILSGMPDPIKPLTELNPEITQKISDAILKGMDLSQDKRFESAREMQKTLRKSFNEMQKSMAAQTAQFNLTDADVVVPEDSDADAKTEAISDFQIPVVDKTNSTATDAKTIQTPSEPVNYQTPIVANASVEDFSAEKTEVIDPKVIQNVTESDNLDATVQFNGQIADARGEEPEGLKTEAITKKDLRESTDSESYKTHEEIPAAIPVENKFKTSEDIAGVSSDYITNEFNSPESFKTSEDTSEADKFSPDATVPLIHYDAEIIETKESDSTPASTGETESWDEGIESVIIPAGEVAGKTDSPTVGFSDTDNYSTDNTTNFDSEEISADNPSDFKSEEIVTELESNDDKEPVAVAAVAAADSQPTPQKQNSSTGKYIAILGGLGAVLFLLLGSILAIGWYYSNGGFDGDGTDTTTTETTPEVTPEVTPSVESNPEVVDVDNTNTDDPTNTETTEVNSNTAEEEPEVAETETTGPTTTKPDKTQTSRSAQTRKTQTAKQSTRTTTSKPNTKTTGKNTTGKNTGKKPDPKPTKKKPKNAGVL